MELGIWIIRTLTALNERSLSSLFSLLSFGFVFGGREGERVGVQWGMCELEKWISKSMDGAGALTPKLEAMATTLL